MKPVPELGSATHSYLRTPESLRKSSGKITKEKNESVRGQDFEKAGELRDREMDLRAQISALIDKNKEMSKAESEAGDGGATVTEADIQQHVLASWTGIPVDKVSADESDRLLKMEDTLYKRIIGQDEAVVTISRAIRRACAGLKNPSDPLLVSSFLVQPELENLN